jgi:uncharacterized cupredoxin-like copper-binding protein
MSNLTETANNGFVFGMSLAGALTFAALADAGPGKKGHAHGHNEKAEKAEHKHQGHQSGHQGGHDEHKGHEMHGGMPGKAGDVSRTVVVIAKDTEFNLKKIQVKDGETVRFIIKNKGELLHEFTIGPHEMQKHHQAEMQKMMDEGKMTATRMMAGMEHAHGNSAMVEPGKQAEIIWMFHKGGDIEFGCNIPGHYESGMKGEFVVTGSS